MSKLEELQKQYEKTKTEYERLGEEIEKLKKEKGEIKLYDIVEFRGFEWYVIEKTNESLKLFMRDKLSSTQIDDLFDSRLIDSYHDVRFNPNCKNIWWADSPIRMVLNDTFLTDLYTNDMQLMTTTVSINGQERTTEDYVKLITKEEIEQLPNNIRGCSGEYGYWTMSPSHFLDWAYAREMYVASSGELAGSSVSSGCGVRPVIQLKADVNNITKIEN